MGEPFLGEIKSVAFPYAPKGWAFCNGQLLSIAQNTALFSLLGTTYGGNGQTTFALPNLQSQVAVHAGQGPGLDLYVQGEVVGQEAVTLNTSEIPPHNHLVAANGNSATTNDPSAGIYATPNVNPRMQTLYTDGATNTSLAPGTVSVTGGNQPHENRQPFLVNNYIIALIGIFPSRN